MQGGALWVNWFLVFQLPRTGLIALGFYVVVALVHYMSYGASHSVGNCSGWSLVLAAAEVANGDMAITSDSSPCSTIDVTHDVAGLLVEDGVDAPLLGRNGSRRESGEVAEEAELVRGSENSPALLAAVTSSQQPRAPGSVSPGDQKLRRRSSDMSR